MYNLSPFNAFSYMFKDNKFWTKFGTLFILTFLCLLQTLFPENKESFKYLFFYGIVSLIVFGVNILYYGYLSAGIKSIAEQNDNFILPFFNFKTHGIIGLKFMVGGLMFSFAAMLVFLIIGIGCGIVYALIPPLGTILGIIFILAIFILLLVYCLAFYRIFAITQDIFAFFKIKEIFKSVKDNFKNYIKYLLTTLLLFIPIAIVCIIFCILSVIPAIISPYMAKLILTILLAGVGAYANMVIMYICAKCIQQ